jgi:hypothetical protein
MERMARGGAAAGEPRTCAGEGRTCAGCAHVSSSVSRTHRSLNTLATEPPGSGRGTASNEEIELSEGKEPH